MDQPTLTVVMYHYVRAAERNPFPALKSMDLDSFVRQVNELRSRYEMATLESALALLRGEYMARRPLCLLTFDDGVQDHYQEVGPVLADRGIQGVFFLVTGCMEEGVVAAVHKNHFLTAGLGFAEWQRRFRSRARAMGVEMPDGDAATAVRTYPWDTADVAAFKYAFNFQLPAAERDAIVDELFAEEFGDESTFARELYLSWDDARDMQCDGMVFGGHTHRHQPLASLSPAQLRTDLEECRRILDLRLRPQPQTPFSYPYGKRDSFTAEAARRLRELEFCCAFSTESGRNQAGADRFAIQRVDCKHAA
jgi:peptidoglycan/xylan/chitin deacetylase (PgdA/CDA1 family)